MARLPRHPASPRPQRHRVIPAPGPTPLGRRTDHVLAVRLPTPAPPLRTQAGTLPRLHRHRRNPHMPPQTDQAKCCLSTSSYSASTSTSVTCLISPPRHSSLAVVRCRACSTVEYIRVDHGHARRGLRDTQAEADTRLGVLVDLHDAIGGLAAADAAEFVGAVLHQAAEGLLRSPMGRRPQCLPP